MNAHDLKRCTHEKARQRCLLCSVRIWRVCAMQGASMVDGGDHSIHREPVLPSNGVHVDTIHDTCHCIHNMNRSGVEKMQNHVLHKHFRK